VVERLSWWLCFVLFGESTDERWELEIVFRVATCCLEESSRVADYLSIAADGQVVADM